MKKRSQQHHCNIANQEVSYEEMLNQKMGPICYKMTMMMMMLGVQDVLFYKVGYWASALPPPLEHAPYINQMTDDGVRRRSCVAVLPLSMTPHVST